MNDLVKNILLWVGVLVVGMMIFQNVSHLGNTGGNDIYYSQFLDAVKAGEVKEVTLVGRNINGVTREGKHFSTYNPETLNSALIGDLSANHVTIKAHEPEGRGFLQQLFISAFPMLLLIGVWIYFMRQMQGGGKGGGGGAMSFGRSKAKMLTEDQIKVGFADVAGCEEAKEEVAELVEFLRDPDKFQRLGGQIPRGVLMVGPPGTGKTLLARAIAGEAKVPFFSISGSDFVEMFVGVGASRVRDMFEQAKKHAPCIIFIDEIDAVGRHRGSGIGGGNDEREQTLNQLLVEMDGFEGNEGVIVIAATNRADVLDNALLRPGRFDRQVTVALPDVRGREQILQVHLRKVPAAKDVKLKEIARGTPGFSGAQLASLVNEAALRAARNNQRTVSMDDMNYAREKIMMGAERKSLVMSEEEKKMTAYHESGHAIVGWLVPQHDPVYKVTIVPRGQALGLTHFLPEGDSLSESKTYWQSKLASAYGGRIAEALIYGDENISTGASGDIKMASQIARAMVHHWGFSEALGPISYVDDNTGQPEKMSNQTAQLIDSEVKRFIDEGYQSAYKILTDNIDKLHAMTDALMKYETLDNAQMAEIMAGKAPTPPADWSDDDKSTGSGGEPQAQSEAGPEIDKDNPASVH